MDSHPNVTPTADAYAQACQCIDLYIQTIAQSPDNRAGAFPYYTFHQPNEPIRGTVLMFHGFSAKPAQMWRLADYLFNNGYNVYQATLAGHAYSIPDRYWPQVDLKPEIADPLRAKVQHDPVLASFLANLAAAESGAAQSLNPVQMAGVIARLNVIEPRLFEIIAAIEDPQQPDFDRYFDSSHLAYLEDASARLADLASLPGPIYTVGLSVGGAAALAVAATHPTRVEGVVAYAPLLRVYGADREKYVNLAGPLDFREVGWDQLRFPLGCFTAANCFGRFVRSPDLTIPLISVRTLLVLTENEDAADIETNQQFSKTLSGGLFHHSSAPHELYTYPKSDLVPHPMVDPQEISQGMSNSFWQSLYQETFRFLAHGQFNPETMSRFEQDSSLPQVPPV